MKVVTEEMIISATQTERCQLMREIINGATYSPKIKIVVAKPKQ